MKKPLYIIDAYALIYRSYFAFMSRPLRTPEGKNVSALFGFANAVVHLIKDKSDICLVSAYDSRTPTFRHKMYSQYKANRQKAPEDLHEQVPLTEQFLSAIGITALKAEGFEADDIIASLAQKCKKEKRECYIISGDKDLLQLVGDGVWELRQPKKAAGGNFGSWEKLGAVEVKSEWGVLPKQVLDLLALIGDASDNVPGVKGIGEKSAIKLLTRFGSLDEIYKHISIIEGSLGSKLAAGKDDAYLSRELITLVYDVPLATDDIESFSVENLNREAGAAMLLSEGILSVAKELNEQIKLGGAKADKTKTKNSSRTSKPDESQATNVAGKYKCITDINEAESFLRCAQQRKTLTFDFETSSLDAWNTKPLGISFCIDEGKAVYIPLAPCKDNNTFISPNAIKELLEAIFYDPSITVIAHNIKFDYEVARAMGFERFKCKMWDTMIAAWICDPSRTNYSLESLAAYYLKLKGISFSEIVTKTGTFADVPLQTATQYCCEDSDFCLRLKNVLEKELKKLECEKLFSEIEMPLIPILADMESVGIKIDAEHLEKYGIELGGDLQKIQTQTWTTVGHEFNLSSPKQLQEVLFVERGLKPTKKTKTGYSTDVAVLEELAPLDLVPDLILRHRTLSKLKSTYVDSLPNLADKNGRIHSSFIQTGTATGRLSSRDPNLQNIPIRDEEGRRIRQAFLASEGNLLVSADYCQIELVVLAHLSGDAALIDAFNSGKDVHSKTAALIFQVDEDKVDPSMRRIAKTINFGVMYGMSAFRLANELDITRTNAANFIDAYFNTYSGVRKYIDTLILQTEKTGFAQTLFGRRRIIPTINSVNKTEKAAAERVAVNTPIQGSAADIVKLAMIDLDKKLIDYPDAKLLLQVHDELILECKKEEAEKLAALVKSVMESAVPLRVPLRVSVETAPRWGEFH